MGGLTVQYITHIQQLFGRAWTSSVAMIEKTPANRAMNANTNTNTFSFLIIFKEPHLLPSLGFVTDLGY
jgi:hypothetical protein